MTEMSDMRTVYGETLIKVGEENPNIVVVGADTTDSLKTRPFGKKFPNRFFNVGIAEANLVSKHLCNISARTMCRSNTKCYSLSIS